MASNKPIFCCTHPRACSTAFERVFMTRPDILTCIHEPFGDAFYFGPERLSSRYELDSKAREESGFADSTFNTIFERIGREDEEAKQSGKRLFIKDITHYLVPPDCKPATIAPSLVEKAIRKGVGTSNGPATQGTNGVNPSNGVDGHANNNTLYPFDTTTEPGNPTVVPSEILKQFHFTFLIRHPRYSIPSYYRCTIPPLDKVTGFYHFIPSEAGYSELRQVLDFLRAEKQIGPSIAGDGKQPKAEAGEVSITVIDADDLLDNPEGIISAYCKEVGIEYKPEMLVWDTEEAHQGAKEAFEKWEGFHNDAIDSISLKPRSECHWKKKKDKTVEEENSEWAEKYGEEGQRIIRGCVDANVKGYEYLSSFALKV